MVVVECMLGNKNCNLNKYSTTNNVLQNTIIELIVSIHILKNLCFLAHFNSEYSASLNKGAF